MSSSSSVRHLAIRANVPSDGVLHLLQFTTTCRILRPRISGPNTRIVQQMALITTFPIRRWARPTSRMRAAYSRHTLSQPTCFPMLVLSSIRFSSVKRFGPPGHLGSSSTADGHGLSSSGTRPGFPASCFHSRRLSSIRKLHFVFWSLSTRTDPPLEKRFPNISQGREHQRDIFVCRPGTPIWQQRRDFEQDSCG